MALKEEEEEEEALKVLRFGVKMLRNARLCAGYTAPVAGSAAAAGRLPSLQLLLRILDVEASDGEVVHQAVGAQRL